MQHNTRWIVMALWSALLTGQAVACGDETPGDMEGAVAAAGSGGLVAGMGGGAAAGTGGAAAGAGGAAAGTGGAAAGTGGAGGGVAAGTGGMAAAGTGGSGAAAAGTGGAGGAGTGGGGCAVASAACTTCYSTLCATEQTACNGDQQCANANNEVGQCLCSHQAGDGDTSSCVTEFQGGGAVAKVYADCVIASCTTECGI